MMTLLVDSSASQHLSNLTALKNSPTIYEALCRVGKREKATVRLAYGTLVKPEVVYVELAFSFSDFSCKENFTVLGMESPYDLILGMPWLVKHQPWIDWRTCTVARSKQDTVKDVLLREANVTDAVFNALKDALTVSHTSPKTNQLDESGVVNSELNVSQVSLEPAKSQGTGAIVRDTLATTAKIPNFKSRNVVVRRVTRTRRIVKTIKGTLKGVTFRSVSAQEDGPTNEMFEVVEDKMSEASSTEVLQRVSGSVKEIVNPSEMTWDLFLFELKEGKIHEIVGPVPKDNLWTSSTMDESVLETDKTKQFAAQGWDATKISPFYEVLWKHRGVFLQKCQTAHRLIRVSVTRLTGTWHQVLCDQAVAIDERTGRLHRPVYDKRAKAGHVSERKSPQCSPTFPVHKATGG